ncbi:hypothetical protein [Mesorhizobium sp.]|uniref:hypothetical protein n=1 Tax=Mesorhizobium sp. TaxID=1871066 RepID=UPI000FE88A37|nr:hypothetical protein [Mesorhizobium sp.]RWM29474.1 MAG: hypothetical protein EOR74_07290 [Mesorhizobium sp.]RWM42395.1 MAG: hypothetical protein EOR75_00545 [Mesorhizobium sp.]TJV52854.1 MAG: hypothetical protein E5Y01_06490 [Mesorhizobium sp.]
MKCITDNPIILAEHFQKEVLDNQAICDTDFDVLISAAAAAYDLGKKKLSGQFGSKWNRPAGYWRSDR